MHNTAFPLSDAFCLAELPLNQTLNAADEGVAWRWTPKYHSADVLASTEAVQTISSSFPE